MTRLEALNLAFSFFFLVFGIGVMVYSAFVNDMLIAKLGVALFFVGILIYMALHLLKRKLG